MKWFKNNYSNILSVLYIAFIIILYISIIIGILINHTYKNIAILALATISIVIIAFLLMKKKFKLNIKKFFYGIVLVLALIYISLLFLPYNAPFVDYETFYYSASQFAINAEYNFKYIALFPHLWGYIMFLGTIFKIFGISYSVVVASNIILTFITAYFIFKIIKRISTTNKGYLGAILWLINPINIIWCMFAFGGTAFNAFFAISIYITILFFKTSNKKQKILYSALLGITLGIANLFRPVIIIFIIAILIEIIYNYFIKKSNYKLCIFASVLIMILCFTLLGKLSNIYLEKETGYVPANSIGFTLYSGSDLKSNGSWSEEGSKILTEEMQKEPFDASRIQEKLQKLAIENYKNNGIKNVNLMARKLITLTSNLGGYSWSNAIEMINMKIPSLVYNLLLSITLFSYYFLILMNGLFGFKYFNEKDNNLILNILILILIGFTLASLLLEVSSRYYLPALVPFTILGTIGLINNKNYNIKSN